MGKNLIHKESILWIEADGTKLPTLLVFKGEPDDWVYRKLNKNLLENIILFAYYKPKG